MMLSTKCSGKVLQALSEPKAGRGSRLLSAALLSGGTEVDFAAEIKS